MKRSKPKSKVPNPLGNLKNPLERSNFIKLIRCDEQVATFDGNKIKRMYYEYKYRDYRTWDVKVGSWTLLTFLEKNDWIDGVSRDLGLLMIDRTPVCVSCMTSEYVRYNEKLNGGDPVCQRCGTSYLGWK